MFRIKASYADQLELRTTLERAREFFGELRNFADLMPGIEGIRNEAGGIIRWMVRAEVPIIGAVQASFTVEKTEDFAPALDEALKQKGIRLLHCKTDVEQISNATTITKLREKSRG